MCMCGKRGFSVCVCGRRGVSVCMYMYERVCVCMFVQCTCRCKLEKKWYLKYCIRCHVQYMYKYASMMGTCASMQA